MLSESLKKLLEMGYNRNILVYDCNGDNGILSNRLMDLTCQCMRNNSDNGFGEVTDIIVGSDTHTFNVPQHIKVNRVNCKEGEIITYLKNTYNGFAFPKDKSLIGIALNLRNGFEDLLNNIISEDRILMFAY